MDSSKPILQLTTSIGCLKGIGPKRRLEFEKNGLKTVEDLLYYFPFRYEDRRELRLIVSLKPGETALISGSVAATETKRTRRPGFKIFRAVIEDASGRIVALWFNQPYLANTIKEGYSVRLYGEVLESGFGGGVLEMTNPQFEVGRGADAETGIVPVYERIGSTGGAVIRKTIRGILESYRIRMPSAAPQAALSRLGLMSPSEALIRVHCPPSQSDVSALNAGRAREQRSLVFDEFFLLQAGLAIRRMKLKTGTVGIEFRTSAAIRETLKRMLPFRLTPGQKAAFKEIVEEMTAPRPMRRLLQGDVGCGKTIVALLAAALAVENGYQAAFMAPTEILAEQHLGSVRRHLSHTDYRIRLLVGSLPPKEREKVRGEIAAGEVDLVVGTHALIQEGVTFKRLGLAVIDEQHRFGVLQRARLMGYTPSPDVLIMTATPIPRSLTMTLFGDLSYSSIKDKPPGRREVTTAVRSEKSRARIDAFLESQMKEGRQVYAVAPVIEESSDEDLSTVKELFERLRGVFPQRRVGLLHGRMSAAEREAVMSAFAAGETDILACTTVIEVGVDVPNASVMLIENAERFGLSQLHQLRGRVGRGEHRSYCILLYRPTRGVNARQRLEVMARTSDGFEIAEKDLELRGPGEFFGTRQSGMPRLRVGNILKEVRLLQAARNEAFRLILSPKPEEEEERRRVVETVRRAWEKRFGLVLVG
jgi:ATP-dependent DNA helicase RecG